MKIKILTVGELENPHLDALADLYLKRIRHYLPIAMESIKPERIKNLSDEEIRHREAEKLYDKWGESDYHVALAESGKPFTSVDVATFFNRLMGQSIKNLTFIVGGPLGLSKDLLLKANQVLSLSKMTMPHEFAAVFLLEQMYRAQTILHGGKYHK